MAQAPAQSLPALLQGFSQLSNTQKIGLVAGIAAVIALIVVALLWARTPQYRILYSNLSDKDGGDVIAGLAALSVPYRVAEGGTAILVPTDQVYEARLKLAQQGLPRGGAVGFELMEAQKFGISQFAEQVNYQRALAGELSRTIQSFASVQAARVHLAIPRPTVFVREAQKPSASVLVNMYAGRTLDAAQVNAIQHLVASSVPELAARSVTVVDQTGNLLSGGPESTLQGGLDAAQLKYLHTLEGSYANRIENILEPIVGPDNVRAQVTASLDFAQVEQTSESFKPNPAPQEAAIRSQQTVETLSSGPAGPSGVPGALSNQPPGAASAPLNAPAVPTAGAAEEKPPVNTHRENTVNYEVDKTIRHTRGEVGAVKRLSVAVVVNYRRSVDQDNKTNLKPLTEQEMTQVGDLVREAIGYNRERGDTVNVVNAPFTGEEVAGAAVPSEWSTFIGRLISPSGIGAILTYLGVAIVVLIALGILRSTLRNLSLAAPRLEPQLTSPVAEATLGAAPRPGYETDLQVVKDLARQDPRIVANVVKDWVGRDE